MKRFIIALVVVFAVAAPAFAIPDHDQIVLYYDAYGNVIGEHDITCGYPYFSSWGDTTGDISTLEIIGPCNNNVEPLTCADAGLGSIANCGPGGWCTSQGYIDSFYNGVVPDCNGDYYSGG